MTPSTNTIRKILIVEDDYQLASEWQNELSEKGFFVDAVTSADEANLLLKNNYDCFILDLFHVRDNQFLPDGGIKCIGSIRRYEAEKTKKSLIIAVTGFFRNESENIISTNHVISNLGADHVLEKPITISAIIKLILQ